ncbi:PfkB family carbohydrate kinase [Pyrobaculum neutrophilum]|uniref:PfkB domain protein n=1 Tax=Pyrobaculum neutrophilum (strain DSM 2338 / JCM 9278 / NBRC 100436 / V24Sta) TaxID=444157 RepID=B1Y9S8_PYRNV|nr:PfkB family carbohydrate kinase [Pyrobaculum neutrophilum]ACB40478.1 PfkB domain protein [Pyrobaculum neutrophilum V24Sta]
MEIVVASNPTVDIVYTSSGVSRRLGGPIYYASQALSALHANARAVGVASLDVAAELERVLAALGIVAEVIIADATTTFELDYRTKPRTVKLVRKPSIGIGKVRGDVVILSPVYDELRNARVEAKAVVADLQGYLRSSTEPPQADLVHFSQDDLVLSLKELVEFAGRWPTAVYTLGEDGAYVVQRGSIHYVNSARIPVEDVTGSGDVFLASLTYLRYVKGLDLLQAVCEASKYVAGFLKHRRVVRHDFDCTIQAVQG